MPLRASAALLLALLLAAPAAAQCVFSAPFGSGCGIATPFLIPTIACSGAPSIGNQSFALTTSAPCVGSPSAGALLIGNCLPSPIQFTDGPATGLCVAQAFCGLYLAPYAVLIGTPAGSGFVYQLPVPADPLLVGLQLCMQGAHTCTGLSCVSVTNNVRVTVF